MSEAFEQLFPKFKFHCRNSVDIESFDDILDAGNIFLATIPHDEKSKCQAKSLGVYSPSPSDSTQNSSIKRSKRSYPYRKRKYHKKQTGRDIQYHNGKWSEEETMLYTSYLESQQKILRKTISKKEPNFFVKMSTFISTRSAIQCRSHHQKMRTFTPILMSEQNLLSSFGENDKSSEDSFTIAQFPDIYVEEHNIITEDEKIRDTMDLSLKLLQNLETNDPDISKFLMSEPEENYCCDEETHSCLFAKRRMEIEMPLNKHSGEKKRISIPQKAISERALIKVGNLNIDMDTSSSSEEMLMKLKFICRQSEKLDHLMKSLIDG